MAKPSRLVRLVSVSEPDFNSKATQYFLKKTHPGLLKQLVNRRERPELGPLFPRTTSNPPQTPFLSNHSLKPKAVASATSSSPKIWDVLESKEETVWRPLPEAGNDPLFTPLEPTTGPAYLWDRYRRYQMTIRNISSLVDNRNIRDSPQTHWAQAKLLYTTVKWGNWSTLSTPSSFFSTHANGLVRLLTLYAPVRDQYPDESTRTWRLCCCTAIGSKTLVAQCRNWLHASRNLAKTCRTALFRYKLFGSPKSLNIVENCYDGLSRTIGIARLINPLFWIHYRYLRREQPKATGKAAKLLVSLLTNELMVAMQEYARAFKLAAYMVAKPAHRALEHSRALGREVEEIFLLANFRNPSMPRHEALAALEKAVDERIADTEYIGKEVRILCERYVWKLLKEAMSSEATSSRALGREVEETFLLAHFRNPSIPRHEALAALEKAVNKSIADTEYTSKEARILCERYLEELLKEAMSS